MNRVFIQDGCKYPHSGAHANYIQNLAYAVLNAGYEVIMAVDINLEYDLSTIFKLSKPVIVIPITRSDDEMIRKRQHESGFCDERLGVLKKYKIDNSDIVIVMGMGLRSEYFLKRLFEYGKEIGFRTICGVLELFAEEDFCTKERYEKFMNFIDTVYVQSNAILSISEYIDKYFINKGVSVFRLPPMVDCGNCQYIEKETDKYRFVIPSEKDSLRSMLMAFTDLEDEEAKRIELHLCGVKEEYIKELISCSDWKQLMKFTVIHPWMKYEELVKLYQQMHFLLIARNECQRTLANFPSKVPETMAYGVVPVVSAIGDYTRYYLQDGKDSIFMDGDSPKEVRKAIRKAINLKAADYEYYSKNACQTAKERFDFHVWIPEVKRMLESV